MRRLFFVVLPTTVVIAAFADLPSLGGIFVRRLDSGRQRDPRVSRLKLAAR